MLYFYNFKDMMYIQRLVRYIQKLIFHTYKFVIVSNLEFNMMQKGYLVQVFCNVRKLLN